MPALRSDLFEMKMPPSVVIPLKTTVCIFACVCKCARPVCFGLYAPDQSSDSACG